MLTDIDELERLAREASECRRIGEYQFATAPAVVLELIERVRKAEGHPVTQEVVDLCQGRIVELEARVRELEAERNKLREERDAAEADCSGGRFAALRCRVAELEAECQRLRERLAATPEDGPYRCDCNAWRGCECTADAKNAGWLEGWEAARAAALAPSLIAEPPANKESPRCGAEGWHGGRRYRCEIAPGHTPPHVAPTQGGMISWEGAPAAESDKEEFDAE
jgi:uncharacterized small protein (DUF1192 family)